jgi:hypothetical protein
MLHVVAPSTALEWDDSSLALNRRTSGYTGHAHFWQRALSRRQFVRTAAGTSALAVGAGLAWPTIALAAPASNADPNPIPGGIDLLFLVGGPHGPTFHVFPPALGQEVSTITDFKGSVAAADVQGTGRTNKGETLTFDADMRFMDGQYVSVDGRTRRGTFGFV